MNKQEKPNVAIIGAGNEGKCMSHSLIESEAHLVQKNQCKEIVLPYINPYKDIDFPSSSKKPKVKKGYWSKGKLKYK